MSIEQLIADWLRASWLNLYPEAPPPTEWAMQAAKELARLLRNRFTFRRIGSP